MAATAFDVFAVADQGDPLLLATVGRSERDTLHRYGRERGISGDFNSIDLDALRKRLGNPAVRRFKLTEAKRG